MCPLKREQARRETQQWVMRRLPTADSIAMFEKTCATSQKNVKSHVFLDFEKT